MSHTTLWGWGLNHRSPCDFVQPDSPRDLASHFTDQVLARGLGRSYGDAALNTNHRVLGLTRLDRLLDFNPATGTLRCEAGATLEQLIATFAPLGWFPLITPGTKLVTVGGCIANDVHGKAHHAQGCFSTCVDSLDILLDGGRIVTATRDQNADLFWAQFGGMGLIGIILAVTLRLRRITTTYFRQKSIVADNLEALLDAIDGAGRDFPYSVASIDPSATGASLGRGVLTVGDHATPDDLGPDQPPLKLGKPPLLSVPFELPPALLNAVTARLVNQVITTVLKRAPKLSHYESFFYPLDAIANWNRGYGAPGFTQYQFVIPLENGAPQMRQLLETIVSSDCQPFLNVLKRLGAESQAALSFPFEGYTLAIDFPIRSGTAALLERLDAMVIEAGGRVYLGKDSYLTRASMRAMYPRLPQWLGAKAKYDPGDRFQSDLGRRVGLCGV